LLSQGSRETNLTKSVTDLRLLQIAPRLPWPLDTGAKLRNYHLARALAAHMNVTLAAFGEDSSNGQLNEAYQRIVTVPRTETYSVGNMLRGAIGRTPLPLLNYTTPEMADALRKLIPEERFDLVQVESIHLMNYLTALRASNQPLVVCDWHNIESDLMRQYAEREGSLARRTYARRTARLMSEAEDRALKEFDAHITVSELDAKRLQSVNSDAKIFVIENGVDASHYANEPSATRNRIVFVASMDYHANIEGATNFARDVWPMIHKQQPHLQFTIVGRNPPPTVTELSSIAGIEVTGSIADVRPYYREALAAVVPLNVGGGSRLKILEAMAAGVPVVSTRLGAEGLDVSDGENIVLAETTTQLSQGILSVIDDSDLRTKLISGGHALVRARYDWSILGAKLLDQYQNLLAGMKRD
jgi:polysaccharide biosynthesis protein PslH